MPLNFTPTLDFAALTTALTALLAAAVSWMNQRWRIYNLERRALELEFSLTEARARIRALEMLTRRNNHL